MKRKVMAFVVVAALCKHGLITGIPGYGKSNLLTNLALQCIGMGIPVTVLECAKKEWRDIKLKAHNMPPELAEKVRQVRIYQAGEDALMPLRIAPFEEVPGVGRDLRFGNICRCLEGALPMEVPVPQTMQTALERMIYSVRSPDDFSFATLHQETIRVVEERGYSEEYTSDLLGALHTRLDSLACGTAGRVFSCARSVPSPADLLGTSKIIELDGLTKHNLSLATLFLMTRLWEIAQAQPWKGGLPRHILILEEAHVALGLNADARPDSGTADPQSYVTEMIVRMLQEFRALGIGVLICDQSPAALPKLVLKNVGTKIAFRVGDGEDRDTMANAMLLDGLAAEDLGRLNCGEAYVWTEGLYRAKKIRTERWTNLLAKKSQ